MGNWLTVCEAHYSRRDEATAQVEALHFQLVWHAGRLRSYCHSQLYLVRDPETTPDGRQLTTLQPNYEDRRRPVLHWYAEGLDDPSHLF